MGSFVVGDLYHDFDVTLGMGSNVVAVDISTDTTTTGATLDTNGCEEVMCICFIGTMTDGDYEFTLYGGDASDMSDEAAVTSVTGSLPDWDDHTADSDSDAHFSFTPQYRYYRVKVVSTNTSSGATNVGCIWVRGKAKHVSLSS
jgi:hypothetical protein